MVTYDPEALKERARNLDQLNGIRMILVDLVPGVDPTEAELEVRLWNAHRVPQILAAAQGDIRRAREIFPIAGGSRLPAGGEPGRVQVTGVNPGPEPNSVRLTVAPIGDYSTYTLGLDYERVDPIFGTLPFKFRPGCFTTDCEPGWCAPEPTGATPTIDYLARDYDSFKHTLIAAMMERVPGWRPTSEADLDETLIELISARGDELADLQDRVMAEAYLGTARKRVSLARHARLMDYHIHQGNQSSTWLALNVGPGHDAELPKGLTAWTAGPENVEGGRQVFTTTKPAWLSSDLDRILLHTWSETVTHLPAGTIEADLLPSSGTKGQADHIRTLIADGRVGHLLLQEIRDPKTCREVGFDRRRRQLLTLIAGSARSLRDPVEGKWVVHVAWREPLAQAYCFRASCKDGNAASVKDISVFCGNLVRAFHGRPMDLTFLPPKVEIDPFDPSGERKRHFEPAEADPCTKVEGDECRPGAGGRATGVICRLPEEDGRLAYLASPPGGEVPSCSTVVVEVVSVTLDREGWEECPSLVHSTGTDPHFVVETDELGRSLIRFGNGTNGRRLPDDATVECHYEVGRPIDGNVGQDSITYLKADFDLLVAHATVWNPFDVTNGREPEPAAEIIRRVPEAYRARQLRAVTLADYVRRAAEVEGVARAAARYAWTGSWRTVQITIDPVGSTTIDPDLRARVLRHLSAVRLIGEDLELREPRFVPLEVQVAVCLRADVWANDVRFELGQSFSDELDRDGRQAFFHPDRWTFGQELHASQIEGRIGAIAGIDHVVSIRMRRFGATAPGADAIVAVRPNEIIEVRNDPDRLEAGTIAFELQGGRA